MFYHPNNATALLIGDFDEEDALSNRPPFCIDTAVPRPIPRVYTVEPPQEGERRFIVRRTGEVAWGRSLLEVRRGAARGHAGPGCPWQHSRRRYHDTPLPGPGREQSHALRDGRPVAVERPRALLGLRSRSARRRPGGGGDRSIREEMSQVARRRDGGRAVKARRQIEAEVIFDRDSTDQIAGSLSEAIAVADWEWYADYPAAIGRVTAEDVRRAAGARTSRTTA